MESIKKFLAEPLREVSEYPAACWPRCPPRPSTPSENFPPKILPDESRLRATFFWQRRDLDLGVERDGQPVLRLEQIDEKFLTTHIQLCWVQIKHIELLNEKKLS